MLNVLRFAWLTSVRQPGRTCLGVLGIVAIGALLFDMLLLSRGLVLSFRELLDRAGFDVRVLATDATPFTGPRIPEAQAVVRAIARLPQVEAVVPISLRDAEVVSNALLTHVQFVGAEPQARPMWTLLEGHELSAGSGRPLLINRNVAGRLRLSPGSTISLRGRCGSESAVVAPLTFIVAGIAEFPFDDAAADTVAGPLSELGRLCEGEPNLEVDMLLVRSNPVFGAESSVAAIRAVQPGLHVVTNEELIERFSRVEFSYFRQISYVLSTVTLFFGFLLIAVLLTASVNQRLGEIAALRAVGLSRARIVAGVLCESMMVVGAGAVLAIPAGAALSLWLDQILRALPGIPVGVHFFVYERRVLVTYSWLLAAASVGAALYPMRIVATLPIAATLRREVTG